MNSGTTTLLVALGAVGLAGWFYTRDKAEDEPESGTDPETGETIRTPADDLSDTIAARAADAGWELVKDEGRVSGIMMVFRKEGHEDAAVWIAEDGDELAWSLVDGTEETGAFAADLGLPVQSLSNLIQALNVAGFGHRLSHHGVGPEHYTFVDVSRTDGSVVGSVHLDAQGMVSTSDPTLGALLQALPPLPPL